MRENQSSMRPFSPLGSHPFLHFHFAYHILGRILVEGLQTHYHSQYDACGSHEKDTCLMNSSPLSVGKSWQGGGGLPPFNRFPESGES